MTHFIISITTCLFWGFIVAPVLAHVSSPRARQAGSDLTPIMLADPLLEPNTISTFPNGTWIENLSVRSADGNFVATVLSAPEIYLLSSDGKFDPVLVAEFPGNLGVLGVVELGNDVFYAVVGNYSVTTATATPGSWSIWELDLNDFAPGGQHHWSAWKRDGKSKPKMIAELPEAGLLNGLTVLNPTAGTILVADSLQGTVWSVNVRTGEAAVVIDDASMKPDAELSGGLAIGINGLSVNNGYLYYDNTNQVTFNRIPINDTTGSALGPAEALIDQEFSNIFPDDFVLDFAGNAWLACEYGHIAFFEGVAKGERLNITVAAGNATGLPHGLTAAKFGTTAEDLKRGSLYVTTNGDPFSYGSETPAQGQLVRYDTALLGFY